jgi:hypothetical protein
MFVQDYSGFTRAAEIQAQGMQNLGATIGQGIKDFGEARQERKKIDAEIKATSAGIESAIKMGKDLGIDIGGYLSPIQAKINDPNTSPTEALALGRTAAQGISNAFTLGIGAQERSIASQRARDENAFKLANLEVAQQRANIYGQKAQAEASELTRDTIKAFDPDTGQDKEWDVWKNKQGDLLTPDKKSRIVDPDKYIYGEPGGVQELPPTSQVGGSINESALPVPLRKYASSFEEQGSKYGVDPALLAAISMHETANGKSSAFRNKNNAMGVSNASGPIQMASVEASIEKMAGLLGKGIHQGKGPYANAKSIEDIAKRYAPIGAGNDPRGLNKYWTNGVSSNYEKLSSAGQSDNSTSMIGDLSQQAMGTPEQQAEVARMIEQGAGMATSQTAPSGAMPTESRINQQPQPAPRRMVGGRPVGGGQQQKTVKVVSGEEAQRFKLKPKGTYELSFNPTGELAGVQTISRPPTETEEAKAEETRVAKEKASASKNIAINTISEFIDDKGVATDALKSAVGYGEAFATGVAEYAPFLGTQSGKTRSDQQRLNRLIEGNILEAASLLKPVSNTDLLMLIKNRPKTTDPEETWTTYLGEIRSILADPNNYLDSGTTPTGPSSQAESDASFIQGFSSGE